MVKALGFVVLLAVSDLADCESPTRGQCERSDAALRAQEGACVQMESNKRQAEPLCDKVVEWRVSYDQKCNSQEVLP